MADKRRVSKTIKQLQRVKTWQLVILLILCGLLAATFLRLNNIGMVERRTAVLNSDKNGSYPDIANRLYDLQRYVSEHMNANPGRVALQEQYNRDAEVATKKVVNASSVDKNIQNQIWETCKTRGANEGWLHSWPNPQFEQCLDKEAAKHPGSNKLPEAGDYLPNPNLYYHEYVSPLWSPDFAGWSLVLCALITLIIIGRFISLVILKLLLRSHYRSV